MIKILGTLVFLAQLHAGFLHAYGQVSFSNTIELEIGKGKNTEPIFYPNPVKDVLYLKKSAAYLIKNSRGLVVKQGFGTEINVSDLPNGTYTLEVRGKAETFVKE